MKLRAILAVALMSAFAVVAGPVSSAGAYPVAVCATLSVSTQNPVAGQPFTVTGSNFDPNAAVELQGRPGGTLATPTSSSTGTFSVEVTLPSDLEGSVLIVAVSGNTTAGSNCPADPSQTLNVQKAGASNSGGGGGGGGGNGGGLSSTGVDVLGLVAIAALLIVVGTAFNRRRQGKRVYTGEY